MANKSVSLSNGTAMPILGLGTWQSKPEEIALAVETALDAGYRHIDTAFAYQNEKAIGEVLERKFKSGQLKREDLFVVTKLHGYYHRKQDVAECLKKSLVDLRLDYVDLYLVHTPMALKRTEGTIFPIVDGKLVGDPVDHLETWQGMEELYRAGKTKAIGLSNFNSRQLARVYDAAAVKPHNLQVECHAYWPQYELYEFCRRLHISFTSYGPIGSPGLRNFTFIRPSGDKASEPAPEFPDLLGDEVVVKIARRHGKTPAQVLLRWLIERDIIVIPKSANPQRIKENYQIFDFALSAQDFRDLGSLPRHNLFRLPM